MSDPLLGTITLLVLLAGLVSIGMPVAFAMLSSAGLSLLIFFGPAAVNMIEYQLFSNLTQAVYIAVPMFTFMASMIESSGISTALYNAMHKWFGGLRGGLAIGTIVICTLISAMTGLAATAVVTMGLVAYPEMKKLGYSRYISLGCIPAGGVLGALIPPSVLMIIVAGFSSVSVGKLFIGGIIPGLLIALLFIIYIAVICLIRPNYGPVLPKEQRANWPEKFKSLGSVILPVLLVILVLGGLYRGAFTPTEAGGVGAFGAILCAAVNRSLNWNTLRRAASVTITVTAMILWLCFGGSMISVFLSSLQVTTLISSFLTGLSISPIIIVCLMLLIVLIMGMFIDAIAIIMITFPIFLPVVTALGIDLLWWCLIITMALLVGLITPPYGLCLFYMKAMVPSDVTMQDIFKSIIPYVLAMLIVLVACVLWPPLLTWLPNQMMQ